MGQGRSLSKTDPLTLGNFKWSWRLLDTSVRALDRVGSIPVDRQISSKKICTLKKNQEGLGLWEKNQDIKVEK